MASVMTARHLFPARQARTTTRQQKNTAERQTTKRQTTSRPPGEHSALAPSSFSFLVYFYFLSSYIVRYMALFLFHFVHLLLKDWASEVARRTANKSQPVKIVSHRTGNERT